MALVPSYSDWKLNPWKYDPIKWDPWELDLYDHWRRVEDWFDYKSPYHYRDYWQRPWYRRPCTTATGALVTGSAADDAREVWSSIGQHGFHVDIDVHAFRPCEIVVKTTADGYVIIEGHHEDHPTRHHHVRKHFMKKYALPVGFTTRDVTSNISKDGILTLKCPPPLCRALPSYNRFVPIDYK